jgi:cystathionine beta-lyase family protein involved in aluminum resistance
MTDSERLEYTENIIKNYNTSYKTIKVTSSNKIDKYNVTAIKKNSKIIDVICNCKGYYYRQYCWHTKKYNKDNRYWRMKKLKWKK